MDPAVDLRRVVKRDGSEQSFDRLRLSESIAAALVASGEKEVLAQQFTETVWIRAANASGRVESEQIAEEVLHVLRLYQCKDAAHCYAWFRREESEIRAGLRVFSGASSNAVPSPWERSRLARSLMRDLYLESNVSRQVARRVERRLVAMGSRHLTGRLVAALAENECRTLGLWAGPLDDKSLGMERRQLRAWLGGECFPSSVGAPGLPSLGPKGQDPRPLLGSEILARFALEEVFSAPQREAWQAGKFDLLALGDWLRPLRLWLHPESQEEETSFWKRVAQARLIAHEVQVFWPAGRGFGDLSCLAPAWLEGPGVHLRCATSDLELAKEWSRAGLWHRIPVQAWLRAEASNTEALVQAGVTSLQWQPPTRLPAEAERSCQRLDQGCVINLVSAAAQSGSLQLDDFLCCVQETLDLACGAMAAICARAHSREHPRVHISPCGVATALDLLFPDSALRHARSRQLLLALRDRFERAARHADLRLETSYPPHASAVGTRLSERCNLFSPKDYGCGWMPGPASDAMLSMALDTAPWIDFPATVLLDSPLCERLCSVPPPHSPARDC